MHTSLKAHAPSDRGSSSWVGCQSYRQLQKPLLSNLKLWSNFIKLSITKWSWLSAEDTLRSCCFASLPSISGFFVIKFASSQLSSTHLQSFRVQLISIFSIKFSKNCRKFGTWSQLLVQHLGTVTMHSSFEHHKKRELNFLGRHAKHLTNPQMKIEIRRHNG